MPIIQARQRPFVGAGAFGQPRKKGGNPPPPPVGIQVSVADVNGALGSEALVSVIPNVQFGAPAPDRWLAVFAASYSGHQAITVDVKAGTADVVTARNVVGAGNMQSGICALIHKPTETQGDLQFTFPAADQAVLCGVLRITNIGLNPELYWDYAGYGPQGPMKWKKDGLVIGQAIAWQNGANVWSGGMVEDIAWEDTSSASIAHMIAAADGPGANLGYGSANGLCMAALNYGA